MSEIPSDILRKAEAAYLSSLHDSMAGKQNYLRHVAGAIIDNSAAIVGWVYEDELPESYPYDVMFPFSVVDGVRMFPVFAPTKEPAS